MPTMGTAGGVYSAVEPDCNTSSGVETVAAVFDALGLLLIFFPIFNTSKSKIKFYRYETTPHS